MMGEIYQYAELVITYLGPAGSQRVEERGLRLFAIIHELYHEKLDVVIEHVHDNKQQTATIPQQAFPKLPNKVTTEYSKEDWRWLLGVVFGDWTQRLWILQEQLLNRCIVALRGPELLNWETITLIPCLFQIHVLPELLTVTDWHNVSTVPWADLISVTYYLTTLCAKRRSSASAGRGLGSGYKPTTTLLYNIFAYANLLKCFDPRDRIYALLGLSSDARSLGIIPDYSESCTLDTIFRVLIEKSLDLMALTLACIGNDLSRPRAASWAYQGLRPNEHSPFYKRVTMYRPHPKTHHQLVGHIVSEVFKPTRTAICNAVY